MGEFLAIAIIGCSAFYIARRAYIALTGKKSLCAGCSCDEKTVSAVHRCPGCASRTAGEKAANDGNPNELHSQNNAS